MMTPPTNTVFPPSSEIWFCFNSERIFRLPGFLFLRFIAANRPNAQRDKEFQILSYWADTLDQDLHDEIDGLLRYLQRNVSWSQVAPFVSLYPDAKTQIAEMWQQERTCLNGYTINVQCRNLPTELFRYTSFHKDRLSQLLVENRIYLPSPRLFNDPFDCSLDDTIRETFIDCGMGCFSTKSDNILLFSHYAEQHQGICFGVDPVKLAQSMSDNTTNVHADIRPIWYFSQMPPLDFITSPALCATCKHDVWSYEEEYRLFLSRSGNLLPSETYTFSQDSLTSVIFGCRASDECIHFVKSITNHHPSLKYFKAIRQPNRFGIDLIEIARP
ncbi:MAG: hypothetical protein WCJ37_17560 [Syntrophus sp. (in: bacteria)]